MEDILWEEHFQPYRSQTFLILNHLFFFFVSLAIFCKTEIACSLFFITIAPIYRAEKRSKKKRGTKITENILIINNLKLFLSKIEKAKTSLVPIKTQSADYEICEESASESNLLLFPNFDETNRQTNKNTIWFYPLFSAYRWVTGVTGTSTKIMKTRVTGVTQ